MKFLSFPQPEEKENASSKPAKSERSWKKPSKTGRKAKRRSRNRPTTNEQKMVDGRRSSDIALTARRGGDRKSDVVASGILTEKRAERQYVRVQLPMEIVHDGRHYKGRDISLDGFAFEGVIDAHSDKSEAEFDIRILFRGYTLTIAVSAALVRFDSLNGVSSYRMSRIGSDQFDTLRRLIRAYLSGQLITFEGFILANDMQTRRSRRQEVTPESPMRWQDRIPAARRLAISVFAVGVSLSLFIALLLSVAERLLVTNAEFAAITAPRIELRAARPGRIANHTRHEGERVAKDDLVISIDDPELDLEIALSRQLIENDRTTVGASTSPLAGPGRFALPSDTFPQAGGSVSLPPAGFGFDPTLERTRLALLQWWASENSFHAPCRCRIETIRRPGDWVDRGEIVASLVDLSRTETRIEAWVGLEDAGSLLPGSNALAILPWTGLDGENRAHWIELTIDTIETGKRFEDRVGWPRAPLDDHAWVRLNASEPISPEAIGRPVEVRFSRYGGVAQPVLWLYRQGLNLAGWATERLAGWTQ